MPQLSAEQAAEKAYAALERAGDSVLSPDVAEALVSVADGWTNLFLALSSQATAKPPQPETGEHHEGQAHIRFHTAGTPQANPPEEEACPGGCRQFSEPPADDAPPGFDFIGALQLLREGARLARNAWVLNDRYVVLQAGYPDGIAINANTAAATGLPEGTVCSFRPYLMMGVADGASPSGTSFEPWHPTATDVLASDWRVV